MEDDPLPEMETHVVHSEPVKPIRIVDAKSIAPVAPKKKVAKKKEKPPANKANRKVLMSEAEVRRLEADIKREQRIRDREKRLNDELALKRAMALTQQRQTTLQKNVLLPQSSSLNMHRTPLGTFVSQTVVSNVPRTPSGPAVKTQKGTPKVPLPAIVKQADAEQLNALLQTVYKRRALKASGATISTPNKGESSKLGDLPNVKFLVVTANYSDLDVLHHLIYMTDAVKAKVRKNILDFSGFGFNEDSPLYKDRIMFLNTLGYDISKRIAFLLGLCPYKTNIDKQDLNELILYFLMSPCKTKQVPITHLPQTFFSKNMPEELCLLMQKHSELDISPIPVDSNVEESQINLSKPSSSSIAGSPLGASSSTSYIKPHPAGPKAKKSLLTSKLKKTTVSPSSSSTPFQNAAVLLKPNTSKSMDTALQKAILKTSSLIPEPVSSPQEFLVQQLTPDGRQKTYKLIKLPMNHPLTTALKPQIPITTPSPVIQLPPIQTTASSILQKPSNSTPNIPTPPVQVPTSGSIIQTPPVQFTSQTSLLSTPPVSLSSTAVNTPGMVIPPGIIIFKDNKNNPPLAITSVPNNNLQTVPIIFGQQSPIILPQNVITAPPEASTKLNVPSPINALTKVILPQNVPSSPKKASTLSEKEDLTIEETSAAVAPESPIQVKKTNLETTKVVSGPASKSPFSKIGPGKKFQLPIQVSKTAVSPVRKPIKSNPPTDNELYSSIKRIIFNSDPEQITLGNVIEKVSVQYASHNLKSRTRFMKDCVKKIILGTT
ncbi:uncharacterized protein [Parasteatoda tepidariorum]|uniref:uncharacterized protein isoform X1 n=1 Tax=Parasteatoda tepidariorum TaxID=114398 RepID=UPI0039BCCA12